MSMSYIRAYYRVPAKRGARVRLGKFREAIAGKEGTVISSRAQYLNVRLDDGQVVRNLHPTYQIEYLSAAGGR